MTTKISIPVTLDELDILLAAVQRHGENITDHPDLRAVLLLEMRLEQKREKLQRRVERETP